MKFPYSMLLDFVETSLTADQAGDLLTMAGFELEGIEEVSGEPVLDIKVMSNRGDGLSMLGLAREVLAKDLDAKPTELYLRAAGRFQDGLESEEAAGTSVSIETEDCNRYACRVFRNLSDSESPDWLQERLRKAGHRSISLIVDLTNYVMLELGQPLHAFDFDLIAEKRIVVRKARAGEKLTTLDGGEHELSPDQMMICDGEKPIAAAGIMGGLATEVSEATENVLLESAHFDAKSVRRTRKQLGLNTEASYRFERSVDPEGVVAAIERFTELLDVAGSEIVDVYPGRKSRDTVAVRVDRARLLLGMEIRDEDAQHYLQRLGMEVGGHGDPFYVVPPTWRPDIVREEDLIEELGRVHGYDKIPERLPAGTSTLGVAGQEYQQVDRLRESVLRHGYAQIISHSLSAVHPLDGQGERIGPRVVASPEYALLRNSLLPNLSDVLQRNGGKNLHLFELGKVFENCEERILERRSLALVSTGELAPRYRKDEPIPNASFFSLKGDLLEVLDELGRAVIATPPDKLDPRLHPTRQASLSFGGKTIGFLGQLHPTLADRLKLDQEVYVAEIDVDEMLCEAARELQIKSISRNPAVRRDIALLIGKGVPFAELEEAIRRSGGEILERFWVFDDFDGTGIPEGMHSLGLALQLRKYGENFTDEEANRVRDQVVQALVELGGSPR